MIWVVEMFDEIRARWEPTVGVALSRRDGRDELNNWRVRNRFDKFMLARYRKHYPKPPRLG